MSDVPDTSIAPYTSVGRLIFKMGGETFEGTAFVVSEKGIFTAAHNLYDNENRQTVSEAYFSLWPHGAAGEAHVWKLPLGPDGVIMPDQWIDHTEDCDNYDMAVCFIREASFAALALPLPVNDAVLRDGRYNAEVIGFQDGTMCHDVGIATAVAEGIVMDGDMIQGASGGPWIVNGIVVSCTANAADGDLSGPNNGPQASELVAALNRG